MRTLVMLALFAAAALFLSFSPTASDRTAQAGPDIVTTTQHVRLGFNATFPIPPETRSDSEPCVDYTVTLSNVVGNLVVAMGANITYSYDRADILPGVNVPVQITYTPTDDTGPEMTLTTSADVKLDFDVDDVCVGVVATGCFLNPIPPCLALAALLAAIDTSEASLDNFNVVAASGSFTAPLAGNAPVTLSGTGGSAILSFAGVDLIRATPVTTLTLSPVPPGTLPGLGGAVALVDVGGATRTSTSVLEWQTATPLTSTFQLPTTTGPTPGPTVTTTLSPVLHWLGTPLSVVMKLELLGVLDDVFDAPSDETLISSSLAVEANLGATLCGAVPAAAQPACKTTITAGNFPFVLTTPELAVIPPIPNLGSVVFTIETDRDGDGLLEGEEIANGCDPLLKDTDGDTLTDFEEVKGVRAVKTGIVYFTDCADPDTDGDKLDDGLEVEFGTDPNNPDTDGDGILDGEDVEWLQNAIDAVPDNAFKDADAGLKTSMTNILDAVEGRVAHGDKAKAIRILENLRRRVDGCGASADRNDWIVDCTAQIRIREFIDLLITNLGP